MNSTTPHTRHLNFPSFGFLQSLSILTRLILFTGTVFFIISLFFISLFTSSQDLQGIWLLLIGWIGLVFFQFAWFANPLNLLALLLIKKQPILALCLSIFALILASQSINFSEIPIGINQERIFIKEMGPGFYFWYVSHVLFLAAIAIETIMQTQKNED